MKRRYLWLILLASFVASLFFDGTAKAKRLRGATSKDGAWVNLVLVGFAGFRGIISEVLWIRATDLQEEGRFFELVQLAEWITALDPYAEEAWTYNAWNLAYNVPALIPEKESRVAWVFAALDLLEHRALLANPHSSAICKEIGWLYLNKIGGTDDDATSLYREYLAQNPREMGNMAVLQKVEKCFGKLPNSSPFSYALYWSYLGLESATDATAKEMLSRQVRQASLLLFEETKNRNVGEGILQFIERIEGEGIGDKEIDVLVRDKVKATLFEEVQR